jgi:SAM-dependent MidA family methyltransferase
MPPPSDTAAAPSDAAGAARPGAGAARLPAPAEGELARSLRLQERIAARIDAAGGWISFADYMQLALYEPGLGYYDAAGVKFGGGGDFVTAPEISPLFAQCLAAPVSEAFERLPRHVLEFGAGTGALARALIEALRERGREPASYLIVEVSADLRARQRERLAGLPVQWLDRLPGGFEGVVVANEVLDVLPVQLFLSDGGTVHERGVSRPGGRLQFAGRPADEALAQAVRRLEALAGPWPPGYGSELCPLAGHWLAALAASVRRGLVLLVDYGFPAREYYHAQRAMGTLMCHYRQHAHADPLWMPGLNDITAHVDFSACAQAARRHGFELLGFTSQARFLLNCGLLDRLRVAGGATDPVQAQAAQRLLSEAEMGELFKVMALGIGGAVAPAAFGVGDRSDRL